MRQAQDVLASLHRRKDFNWKKKLMNKFEMDRKRIKKETQLNYVKGLFWQNQIRLSVVPMGGPSGFNAAIRGGP